MRLQGSFLLVVLAVICGHQCNADPSGGGSSETTTASMTTDHSTPGNSHGWNWHDNYFRGDKDEYGYDSRPRNRDRYNDDSYERRPSRNGYDDDRDDDYDKDNDYDKDDGNDKDYGYDRDDSSYERRPSRPVRKPRSVDHMSIYLREPSKDGKRRKPKRFRFPVANYEREHFPRNFGPLISFMPWLPIFADRLTKQTIIYSPTGGVYILPPVINFYGKLISVAQLIASGYASLVSSGVPPPPAVDIKPLVQPGPVVGPGVPAISPVTGGFKGGVRTDFRSFARPDYPKDYQEKPAYPQRDGYAQPRPGY